jgi:hypothetical protein
MTVYRVYTMSMVLLIRIKFNEKIFIYLKYMTNTYFVTRTHCPSCKSSDLTTIYSCKYTEAPISDYVKNCYSAYSLEWINNPKYLKDADYVLNECRNCSLIFQKHIPNNLLMDLLYDCDIDSPQSIQRKKHKEQKNNFSYYIDTSHEVETLISVLNKKPQELVFLEQSLRATKYVTPSFSVSLTYRGLIYRNISLILYRPNKFLNIFPSHLIHFYI